MNKTQKIVASIEARMGSSRLPGKVLADVCGQPALTRQLRRLRRCRTIDDIILATSNSPNDNPLEQWAISENIAFHRGSEDDVLQRVVEAHRKMNSDVVVEITGDCPLLDPEIIDMGISAVMDLAGTGCERSTAQGVIDHLQDMVLGAAPQEVEVEQVPMLPISDMEMIKGPGFM